MPEESEVAALRPPAWAEKYRWHWIIDSDTDFHLAEWWHEEQWRFSSGVRHHWRALIDRGWRYSHPADPSARVIDPENAAMVECAARVICRAEGNAMTDHIATIRKALDWAANWLGMKFTARHTEAASALDALTAELQRLRDDPNRLDLSKLPAGSGWLVSALGDGNFMAVVAPTPDGECEAISDTPRAALTSAIERIGK